MSTFFTDNFLFRVEKMAANKSRVAKAICNDKLRGGSGLLPVRLDGLDQDIGYRRRQAAFDVICELRSLDQPVVTSFVFLDHRTKF